MKTKTIEYGTTHKVVVISANENLLAVHADDGEGYLLVGHGLTTLPKPDDKGIITFTKSTGLFKGYWKYSPVTK